MEHAQMLAKAEMKFKKHQTRTPRTTTRTTTATTTTAAAAATTPTGAQNNR